MKNIAKEGVKEIRGILGRIKRRDFSGNSGQAIKNSGYQLSTTLVAKGGSLLFTIILARLLLPELFGLYSLALSTIIIFSHLSNLGISQTLIKFISSSKNRKKSKEYFSYLLKCKIILSLISATILVIFAKLISKNYYNKPIFLALIAGSLYILISGITPIFNGLFQAANNFKKKFHTEIIFQISRLTLVPIGILLTINYISSEGLLSIVFIALSISFLVTLTFIAISARKQIPYLKLKSKGLNKEEKTKINKFIIALSAMTISGVLFGYIDIIILGRYVGAEFIGFYRAAFSLITSIVPLITFSGALFPLFSRLKGRQLKRGFKKSMRLTAIFAIPVIILTSIFAPLIVNIIFGTQYFQAANIVRIFAILIFILPLTSIYSSFLISQNKPKIVAQSLIISTTINIILNYIFIISLLPFGQAQAVYGAATATIISKVIYLAILAYRNKAMG